METGTKAESVQATSANYVGPHLANYRSCKYFRKTQTDNNKYNHKKKQKKENLQECTSFMKATNLNDNMKTTIKAAIEKMYTGNPR